MGVQYDYFRAPGPAEVQAHMAENEVFSPVPETFDGIQTEDVDPSVVLGQLVAFAAGRSWSADLVDDDMVWPADGEQNMAHEGPWVTALDDGVRDVLAAIPAERVPELAERWARIDEFDGTADVEALQGLVSDLAALAGRAQKDGESLFSWMAL